MAAAKKAAEKTAKKSNPQNPQKTDLSERKRRFLKALKEVYGIDNLALEKTGTDRKTVWNWRQDDPEFLELYNEAKERPIDMAEVKLFEQAAKGNMQAITLILKGIGKKRGHSEQIDVTTNGNSINNAQTVILAPMTAERLAELGLSSGYEGQKVFEDIDNTGE